MQSGTSGAGAATAAGITFQENVAAWLVCQILAGPNRTSELELPAGSVLENLTCESLQPVDDMVVGATDRTLYFQCKTTLDVGTNSEFVKVIRQFAEQFLKAVHPDERYVLAVSETASAQLRNSLRQVLRLIRGKRGDERSQEIANKDQVTRKKYETFCETARDQIRLLRKGKPVDEEDVLSLVDRIMIYAAPFGAGACTPDTAIDKLSPELTQRLDAKRAWEHIVSVVRDFSPMVTSGIGSMPMQK